MKIKVLMADDHALFRDGMRYVLQQLADEVEILDSGNFQDALQLVHDNTDVDLALLDLNMPGSEGVSSSGRKTFCTGSGCASGSTSVVSSSFSLSM